MVVLAAAAVLSSSLLYGYPLDIEGPWQEKTGAVAPVHPSGDLPDNIVLTPAFDMETAVTVTWRTSGHISGGMVQYIRDDAPEGAEYSERTAESTTLTAEELRSDRTVNCHTAILTGLVSGTTYRYRVGDKALDLWSDFRTFTTAPGAGASFSFVYFGDTQADSGEFGRLLDTVERERPETLFYMIGGDIVDRGILRNQWDGFLESTGHVFSRKPLAPAMGNHDFADGVVGPRWFTSYFGLTAARNGESANHRNYSFRCGGVFFVVLNNRDPKEQAEWLEGELIRARQQNCDFIVVMVHYPVYNTKKGRSNPEAQKHGVPLFDNYGVDLVLSGHDHSYMRSRKLRAGRPAPGGTRGTTYVNANACAKNYPFRELDIAVRQFNDIPTYQILTTGRDAGGLPVLRYQSCAADGAVMDEFELFGE